MATASARAVLPLRPLFIATILLGSFLLFLIQPMFARAVLPLLGGSPSVWNTAMLFYQVTLLLGYLYAHLVRNLPVGRQLLLHLSLFGLAALTLPVGVAQWLRGATDLPPVLWLLALMTASIGPVFLVTSSQAPLMQSWFGRSNHPDARNPYFLYAASNLGSFGALLAYPLLLEPTTALAFQSQLWSLGFVVLAGLVALCGLSVMRGGVAAVEPVEAVPITWAQRGRWTLLAFVASGLLLSTTTHLTTDIAAMPLLWVIPLGAYLMSFVLAFGDNGPRWTMLAQRLSPVALLVVGVWACLSVGPSTAVALAAAGILLLFIIALALHGTLSMERPAVGGLTDYYLWISVGGALGGVLCALIAPVIFDWPYEHPLLLVAAAALIQAPPYLKRFAGIWDSATVRVLTMVGALIAGTLSGWMISGIETAPLLPAATPLPFAIFMFIWLMAFVAVGRRDVFAVLFAALLLSLGGIGQIRRSATDGARERSFFGVYTVYDQAAVGRRLLLHGTTLHGSQSLTGANHLTPMSYYAPPSGVGVTMAAAPQLFGPNARIGFVGLGAGTLACYARPEQQWTAYEIDPVVVTIAKRSFSYIKSCRPDLPVIIGDARLTLQQAPAAGFDLLAVDAFSSDSIPLHLVTREAFGIYQRALQKDGVLLIHISNNFLELEPMIAAIGAAEGWTVRIRLYEPPRQQPPGQLYMSSTWVALTRTPEAMAKLEALSPQGSWKPPVTRPDLAAWTDDFASILPVIRLPE
jgi:hypothetical protein